MQLIKTLGAVVALATVTTALTPSFVLTFNSTAREFIFPSHDDSLLYSEIVSYANGSLFIGRVFLELYSEPFLAESSGNGGISFLSYHQTPTGTTALYLFPNLNMPVGLTEPHGGYVAPSGATTSGFDFGSDGYLTFGGVNKFIGCENEVPNSYKIYWLGNETDIVDSVGKKCTAPLFLYRTYVTYSE